MTGVVHNVSNKIHPYKSNFATKVARVAIGAAASFLPARWPVTAKLEQIASPPLHGVDFGDLRRLSPVSRLYGWDRGTPVDRYYIEKFLSEQRGAIRGQVLEVSENTYTKKYGGDQVTFSDVLHYDNPAAPVTIVGDLTNAPHIPSNTFDCLIITQTLMMIYDYNAAIETLHRILKPGGSVLCTVPGLSQIADPPWRSTWHWGFTQSSAERMFGDVFGRETVKVEVYGNVLSTISFLQGLAAEELTRAELELRDPDYQMLIAIKATKAAAPANPGGTGQ